MRRSKAKDGSTVLDGGALTMLSALNAFFPIGSLMFTVDSANPNTRAGMGATTWVAWGAGRAVVGVGSNGTNTYTTEQTFGADSVQLTPAQSGVNTHTHLTGGNTGGATARHSHLIPNPATALATANASGTTENSASSLTQGTPAGRFAHPFDPTGGSRQTTDDSPDHAHAAPASGAATGAPTVTTHENRQTSIATFIWKRTA